MDKTDLEILSVLTRDARSSLKEVASRIGLSLPATSERVRKLEKSGVIKGYKAILDRDKLDKEFCCFCLLILARHDSHKNDAFLNFVKNNPDILECHCITGAYEYILKIVTRSPKTLEEILARLRENWGVVKSSTYTVLSSIKEEASFVPLKNDRPPEKK